jgi:TetR/AcrR family transcriptional regulator
VSPTPWAERAADRSPSVQRSRSRSVQQTRVIIDAARRLIMDKGGRFTTQELVKEAGVALQTFYRHFAGKDQLLVAVIGDMIAEAAAVYEERARHLPDPVARLRSYLDDVLASLNEEGDDNDSGPRFVTSEHLRLHQILPDEMAEATRPFVELVLRQVRLAEAEGLLAPTDPERDAWLVTRLVMTTYHHYAFATTDDSAEEIIDHLWSFCLAALGGSRPVTPVTPATPAAPAPSAAPAKRSRSSNPSKPSKARSR